MDIPDGEVAVEIDVGEVILFDWQLEFLLCEAAQPEDQLQFVGQLRRGFRVGQETVYGCSPGQDLALAPGGLAVVADGLAAGTEHGQQQENRAKSEYPQQMAKVATLQQAACLSKAEVMMKSL